VFSVQGKNAVSYQQSADSNEQRDSISAFAGMAKGKKIG
jgi:hypothetical protein